MNVRLIETCGVLLIVGAVVGWVMHDWVEAPGDLPSAVYWERIGEVKRHIQETASDGVVTMPTYPVEADLAVLVSRGELLYFNFVLPTVKQSRKATLLWMSYCREHQDEIVWALGNPSCTDLLQLKEPQPVHLMFWVQPSAIQVMQDLVDELESL